MTWDCLIVGGGLQAGLIALALVRSRPGCRVAIVERAASLGGNHLWSFHEADVPQAARALIEPLVVARWPAYEVAFPEHRRRIDRGYASISSERLDQVVRAALAGAGGEVLLEAEAASLSSSEVVLRGGRKLKAALVIDARGPQAMARAGRHAFQKFAGVELAVDRAPALPILMDACVPQVDGFRFVYALPLAGDRVLVEDTRYSVSAVLDVAAVERGALEWAAAHGLAGEVVRRESGVLPLPLDRPKGVEAQAGAPPGSAEPVKPALAAGYAGGFFHPTTGYSLPAALRLALHLAEVGPGHAEGPALDALRADLFEQQRFCRLLNRLLFDATDAADRFRVLSRFYRLPEALIGRFYALQTTAADRRRILCGRPPAGVSLWRAVKALRS